MNASMWHHSFKLLRLGPMLLAGYISYGQDLCVDDSNGIDISHSVFIHIKYMASRDVAAVDSVIAKKACDGIVHKT